MSISGNGANPSATAAQAVRQRSRHHYFTGGLALVALGLFATAAALAVVKPSIDSGPPPVYQANQSLSLPDTLTAEPPQFTAPFIQETQIRRGDTLAAILQRLNVQEPGLQAFLTHDKSARSIYKLYPGRTVQAALDQNGDLVWLRYHHTPGSAEDGQFMSKWLDVRPSGDDDFTALEQTQAPDTQVRIAQGEVTSSLFAATDAADIPDAITQQMADILGSKIDFMQDLRKGDRFRVIYQSHTHNGKEVGSGRVLALEFNNGNKQYEAVWFSPDGTRGSYYDFDGQSLQGAFLRTALKFSRISSTFGLRKHPVHGKWMGHHGVDYAAASGTPIHATASGTVQFAGWQNGYGNVVILKHHSNITTLYAHLRGFANGLKKGSNVEQGQWIGDVGSTGWATGPHLHYEFRVENKPVDPLSIDLPVARALEGPERKAFQAIAAAYKPQMQLLAALQDGGTQLAGR